MEFSVYDACDLDGLVEVFFARPDVLSFTETFRGGDWYRVWLYGKCLGFVYKTTFEALVAAVQVD